MGEYVFDHAWADAYERAGGRYYPKLQIAAPFTPATGRRLLVAADAPEGAREALIDGLARFAPAGEGLLDPRDLSDRRGRRAARARRLPRPPRRAVPFPLRRLFELRRLSRGARFPQAQDRSSASGETRWARTSKIDWLTGAAIRREHWKAFFAFYMDTGSRKWGRPYLTRNFFDRVGASMADRILLVMAKRNGRYIAGAINFIGDDALYGRNWGAIEERPFLHFEVCYYQAIEFALARGLKRVEAGAQGEHKLARGYRPGRDLFGARIRRPAAWRGRSPTI